MPLDESHNDKIEEGGLVTWKNQKALIFVDETSRGQYGALLLTGTTAVKDELQQMGREIVDHEGLESHYPRTRGLWVFEGKLVFTRGEEEIPEWQGTWRSMNQSDFKDFGI